MDPFQIKFNNCHQFNSSKTIYMNFEMLAWWMLNPQEGGRLDAERYYVIFAKALDGIFPVGHACAVLCWGTAAAAQQLHMPCLSTALHMPDQQAKYHPVPWLRWPNVSRHQVFRLPEGWASIMPAFWSSESIVNLSWTYRESIVNPSCL